MSEPMDEWIVGIDFGVLDEQATAGDYISLYKKAKMARNLVQRVRFAIVLAEPPQPRLVSELNKAWNLLTNVMDEISRGAIEHGYPDPSTR